MTDVTEIDDVIVTGKRPEKMSMQEIQDIIDDYNQSQSGGGGGGGGGDGDGGYSPDPSATLAEILAAIRDFIASVSELDSVGNRDAETRFERNEQTQTPITLDNGDVVYFDNDTQSYWFDQNGNGTFETQFWIGTEGVWYDINNDGLRDTLLSGI